MQSSPSNRKKGESTLMLEKGNISLQRVSDETKVKTAAETKLIEDELRRYKELSCRRIKREELQKLRNNENSRKNMIARWKEKTKNNPFSADLRKIEETRCAKKEEKERKMDYHRFKIQTINSMIGTTKFDICSQDMLEVFKSDETTKLALELRKFSRDKEVIRRERTTLVQLMDQELQEVKSRFPAVAEKVQPRLTIRKEPTEISSPVIKERLSQILLESEQNAKLDSVEKTQSFKSPKKNLDEFVDDISEEFGSSKNSS